MRSNADIASVLNAAADDIVGRSAAFRHPVIVIDGRSGAGKSSLASLVARRLDGYLLALDSVYPGWDGLDAGSEHVLSHVLEPRARGEVAVWRRWDWRRDRPAESHEVPSDVALVVEGAGALTPASRELSDIRVWLESPALSRRERALARDGETYEPHWERWASQEAEHIRHHAPRTLADVIVDVP